MPPSISPVVDSTKSSPSVVLADDSVMTRQSLAIALRVLFPSCSVVGEASAGDEALELCLRLKPTVLLTDLRLPNKNGVALVTELKIRMKGLGVVVHTGSESATMLALACDAHPSAVIHTDDGIAGLRKAFEAALTGERYVSRAVMDRIERQGGNKHLLTATEVSVLALVTRGIQTKEVAQKMGVSERTVSSHRESIHRKTRTHDTSTLTLWAMRNGVIE